MIINIQFFFFMPLMSRLFFQPGSVSFPRRLFVVVPSKQYTMQFSRNIYSTSKYKQPKRKIPQRSANVMMAVSVGTELSVQVQWTDLIIAFMLLKQLETAVMTLKCTLEKNLKDLTSLSPRCYFEKPLEPETLSNIHWSHMGNFPSDANRIKDTPAVRSAWRAWRRF